MAPVLESIDVSVVLGAGVSLSLGTGRLFADARYALGLTDLWKGGTLNWKGGQQQITVQAAGGGELKTKGIQIMIGFLYPIEG